MKEEWIVEIAIMPTIKTSFMSIDEKSYPNWGWALPIMLAGVAIMELILFVKVITNIL